MKIELKVTADTFEDASELEILLKAKDIAFVLKEVTKLVRNITIPDTASLFAVRDRVNELIETFQLEELV